MTQKKRRGGFSVLLIRCSRRDPICACVCDPMCHKRQSGQCSPPVATPHRRYCERVERHGRVHFARPAAPPAKIVLQHDLNRRPIEVLFKMSKQHLGLGDYQFLRYRAVERYLHLVMITHLLPTHLACDKLGAKAIRQGRRLPLRLPSVAQMQHTLRSMLWDDAVSAMEQGPRYAEIGKRLKQVIDL